MLYSAWRGAALGGPGSEHLMHVPWPAYPAQSLSQHSVLRCSQCMCPHLVLLVGRPCIISLGMFLILAFATYPDGLPWSGQNFGSSVLSPAQPAILWMAECWHRWKVVIDKWVLLISSESMLVAVSYCSRGFLSAVVGDYHLPIA